MLLRRGESGLLIPTPGIQVARAMPGGLPGAAFSPTDLSNLELWFKADGIGGLSDGDPIATWPDDSGNNRDAIQATAAEKPLYKTNIQNSLPSVLFDNSNDNLAITVSLASGPWLAFAVVKIPDVTDAERIIFDTETGRRWIGVELNDMYYYDGGGHWGDGVTATAQLLEWKLESSGGDMLRNGSSLGTSTYTEAATGGITILGASRWEVKPVNGHLLEFLLYSIIHSSGDRASVRTFLNDKWSLY